MYNTLEWLQTFAEISLPPLNGPRARHHDVALATNAVPNCRSINVVRRGQEKFLWIVDIEAHICLGQKKNRRKQKQHRLSSHTFMTHLKSIYIHTLYSFTYPKHNPSLRG
jgi:hypothetical protein